MLKQSLYHKLLVLLPLALLAWCCSPSAQSPYGLEFSQVQQSLGSKWTGEKFTLNYPFENMSEMPQQITSIQANCGCFAPRVIIDGNAQEFPVTVMPRVKGVVEVQFDTAGFKGNKHTGATVNFAEGSLPLELEVDVFLINWFRQNPARIEFPLSDGSVEQRMQVTFTGQQPFAFTDVLSVTPPLSISNVPSGEPSLSQTIELILPPQTKNGGGVATFNLNTDYEQFRVVGIARYETIPPVWVAPDGKLLLGELPVGVVSFSAVDIGANQGRVELVSAKISGIENSEVRVQELSPGSHLRLQLAIEPPLGGGAFHGQLDIDLIHHFDGKKTAVKRKILIFGVTPTTHK